jgi:hypothetical protein
VCNLFREKNMNKKTKKFNSERNYTIVEPEVVSIDDLAYAADVELAARAESLRTERERAIRAGFNPYRWEIELAYVQREMDIRDDRADAHMIYTRSAWENSARDVNSVN